MLKADAFAQRRYGNTDATVPLGGIKHEINGEGVG